MSNKKKRKISQIEYDISIQPQIFNKIKLEQEILMLNNKNAKLEVMVMKLSHELISMKQKLIPNIELAYESLYKKNQELEFQLNEYTKSNSEQYRQLLRKIQDLEHMSEDNSKSNIELELNNLRIEKELSKLDITPTKSESSYMSYIN